MRHACAKNSKQSARRFFFFSLRFASYGVESLESTKSPGIKYQVFPLCDIASSFAISF